MKWDSRNPNASQNGYFGLITVEPSLLMPPGLLAQLTVVVGNKGKCGLFMFYKYATTKKVNIPNTDCIYFCFDFI